MSRTLGLSEAAFRLGQDYLACGREDAALRVFGKVARLSDSAGEIADESRRQVAQILLNRRQYASARRQLQVALARQPLAADLHYLLAIAHDQDSDGDLLRAAFHYRKAVALDPDHAEYHAGLGQFLLETGDAEEGLEHLACAVELEPDDFEYVRHLALAQVDAGQPDAARRTVLFAMFRNPERPEYWRLWSEVRFSTVRQTQEETRHRSTLKFTAGPVLLPFRLPRNRRSARHRLSSGEVIRIDAPGAVGEPHTAKSNSRRQTR